MKLSAGRMVGVSWEGSGLRLGILLDMSLYLAIVKPAYKVVLFYSNLRSFLVVFLWTNSSLYLSKHRNRRRDDHVL